MLTNFGHEMIGNDARLINMGFSKNLMLPEVVYDRKYREKSDLYQCTIAPVDMS